MTLAYPTRHEGVQRSSNLPRPEMPGDLLDIVRYLQEERRKDLEMREQLLTTELNRVREQLGKAPISQRKLQAMIAQCPECGHQMK